MSSTKSQYQSSLSPPLLLCQYETPTSRWKALTVRDHLASHAFVYAVLTTKIYCRPDCKARLARRANVVFYDTAKEAEKAGFRACKRCKPSRGPSPLIPPSDDPDKLNAGSLTTTPSGSSTTSNTSTAVTTNKNPNTNNNAKNVVGAGNDCDIEGKDTDIRTKIHQAVQLVRTAASKGTTFSLAQLSAQVGLSKWHLQRVFKRLEGVSPREMAERMALKSSSSTSSSSSSCTPASAYDCQANSNIILRTPSHQQQDGLTCSEKTWDGTDASPTHERIAGVAAPTRPPRDVSTHLASDGIISMPEGSVTNGVNDFPGAWNGVNVITVAEPFEAIPEHGLNCHVHMDMNNMDVGIGSALDIDARVDFDMDMDDLLTDLFPELYRDKYLGL
ncbi:hypothetical protein ABEF95_016528 [Exophiala dermatitidis]